MLQFQDRLNESVEDDQRERRCGDSSRNDREGMSLAQQYGNLVVVNEYKLLNFWFLAAPPTHKGISVTKTYKVGDQLVMR